MVLKYGTLSEPVAGGGGTGAVKSVNGKTGDVLLTNDDVNAQKKTSALATGTPDVNDEVAFLQGGVSLRTAIENLPIPLTTRQALLGKLDASQKGAANGVAELDASGKLPVNRLPDAALGGLAYQGGWNATTNTPALTTPATRGYYWVVTTAGSTNIGGVTDWQVGDWVISNGTAWQKIDQTDVVTSVNGKQGAVVLTAADVGAQPADATLTALAALVATANKLSYFTGDDQMALADFTAFARQLMAAVDAAAARTTLDAQKADATLTALAGLSTGVDQLPYFTGTDQAAQTTLTAFARNLLAAVNAATARTVLQALSKGGDVCTGTLGAEQFDLSGSASIVKTGLEAEILGNYSVLIAAPVSSALAGNARSLGGAWAKFDISKRSTILASDGDKIRLYTSSAGSADPFEIRGEVLTTNDQVSGTWTPAVDGVTDFTARNGTYIKTGKFVTVRAYISFIGKTVPANNGVVKGVPFMPATPAGPGGYIPCAVYRGKVADPDMNAYMDPVTGNIIFNRPILRNPVVFESDADYMVSVSYEAA